MRKGPPILTKVVTLLLKYESQTQYLHTLYVGTVCESECCKRCFMWKDCCSHCDFDMVTPPPSDHLSHLISLPCTEIGCSVVYCTGLAIHFFGGSNVMLPSSRPGSKTNFVVAKCTVLRRCCLGLCCALQTLHKNA